MQRCQATTTQAPAGQSSMPTSNTVTTRPTHAAPQTLAQAKRAFTSHGPRISTQQSRRDARGAELYNRAENIKEAEKRRKQNAAKKAAKEERERESRRRMGIMSPRAKKVAASQGLLVGFVRTVGAGQAVGGHWKEPRNDVIKEQDEEEEYMDDTLDDTTLLEATEIEPVIGAVPAVEFRQPGPKPPLVVQEAPKEVTTKASTSFTFSTDFVLARDITWTQDLEAARSFDSELIASPSLTPDEQPGPPVETIVDTWDDFILSNTQIEHEITSSPPHKVAKTVHAKCEAPLAHTNAPLVHSPLKVNPLSEADDSFLSMLSTQDMDFSSPEFDRHETLPPVFPHSPSSRQQKPADSPQLAEIQSGTAARNPPRPCRSLVQPTSARSCTELMPPPPIPARRSLAHETSMPPPPRTTAKAPSPATRLPKSSESMLPPPRPPAFRPNSLKGTQQQPLHRQANVRPQTLPGVPTLPQRKPFSHLMNNCSIVQPTGFGYQGQQKVAVEWLPSDFDLSTQDCRELGA